MRTRTPAEAAKAGLTQRSLLGLDGQGQQAGSSATGSIYLIDLAHAIIVDVEPTPARTYDEVASTKTMLDRTEQRLGLKPRRLADRTAYGTSRFLDWLVGRRIPSVPRRWTILRPTSQSRKRLVP